MTMFLELLVLLSFIYLRSLTVESLNKAFDFIDTQIAKNAWLETVRGYVKSKGSYSRDQIQTYRRAWVERYCLNNYVASRNKQKKIEIPSEMNKDIREELEFMKEESYHEFLLEKVEEAMPEKYNLNDPYDMNVLSMEMDETVRDAYTDEYEVIVQFLMIAVQNSLAKKQQDRKKFIKFIEAKKYLFYAVGIELQVPSKGSIDQRYKMI